MKLPWRGLAIADGAMGTMLLESGATPTCLEAANLLAPSSVLAVHEAYLRAGATVLWTHTFGANRLRLAGSGYEGSVRELNTSAVRLARRAAEPVGGSVLGCVGPTGIDLRVADELARAAASSAVCEQVEALLSAGVDGVAFETLRSLEECALAFEAARRAGVTGFLAFASFDERGLLADGATASEFAAFSADHGALLVGANCGVGLLGLGALLEQLMGSGLPVGLEPSAGIPSRIGARWRYPAGPAEFAAALRACAVPGVRLLGGCCGTTPAYIAALSEACAGVIGER